METIFDYNITDEGMYKVFGFVDTKDDYISFFMKQPDYERCFVTHLYHLFRSRGNKEMAKKHLDMIPNDEYKLFSILNNDLLP